ncbi:hypothetical protein WKW38_22370 [Vibrio alginolyticus]|uniref:hypothetical protein n=1 Tax=Vibrio alginolyticus TaxID=663 RepID=UPI0037546C71
MEIKGIKVEAISKLVKDVVIIVLAGVAILKMIQADIALSFSELSATDLVALLLAVFSVGLSAAFYFAASGSSERFYYNMHKFTKDTSVILGELKEQVKSVDKGQQEVKARVEQYGTNGVGSNNEALETKEKEVVDAREDMHQFISTLFENLKLDQTEKDKLKAELASKEQQLSEHVNQLSEIKANILEEKLRKVKRYLVGHVRRRAKRHDSFEELLEDLIPRSGSPFEEDLKSLGWFEHGEFTSKGIEVISQMYADICDS